MVCYHSEVREVACGKIADLVKKTLGVERLIGKLRVGGSISCVGPKKTGG